MSTRSVDLVQQILKEMEMNAKFSWWSKFSIINQEYIIFFSFKI